MGCLGWYILWIVVMCVEPGLSLLVLGAYALMGRRD